MIENAWLVPALNSAGDHVLRARVRYEGSQYSASVPLSGRGYDDVSRSFRNLRRGIIGMKEWKEVERFLEGFGNDELSFVFSLAAARAFSGGELWSLESRSRHTFPLPMANIMGGGASTRWKGFDIKEILMFPPRAESPIGASRVLMEAWASAGDGLKGKLGGRDSHNAWIARVGNREALDYASKIAEEFGLLVGVDFGANELWDRGYVYRDEGTIRDRGEQMDYVRELVGGYGIRYLEDPLRAGDRAGLRNINCKAFLAGDEAVPRSGTLPHGMDGVVIKPDTFGSVSECWGFVNRVRKGGMKPVPSHRSNETEDCWLADLSVLWDASLLKCGISGGERLAKCNRLSELWDMSPSPRMARF